MSRYRLGLLALCACLSALTNPISRAHADDQSLPPIEAKTFHVTIVRRSRSGNVYLFETSEPESQHAGKIMLLRKHDEPVMAFRVLRDYPDNDQFAAKWVRRYRGITQLKPSRKYEAIEKIADRPGPPLTAQDQADLQDIESQQIPPPPGGSSEATPESTPTPSGEEIPPPAGLPPAQPYDSQLDSTTTPPPSGTPESENAELTPEDKKEIDDLQSLTAVELVPLDRIWNWVSLGFGYFHNNGSTPGGSSGYFSGGNLKYARTLKKMIYFKKNHMQDSIAIEGGLGYYKALSFAVPNDSYTVIPFTVTLRYNLMLGKSFIPFVYAGLNKNFVTGSSAPGSANQLAVSTASSQLSSILPAAGVGALFRVGPNWYTRLDAGIDLLGLSLMLRF